MDAILSCENLVKTYKTRDLNYALNNITMQIYEGELLVIVGASGSGKSTLINILGGIDKCTRGNVYFRNKNITKYNERKITQYRRNNVGFIYQSFNLINELTVYENILLTSDSRKNINKILRKVGLYEEKNLYPKELSGGEQQRVAIARALSKDCDILFCDEPTGALDSENSKKILSLLEELVIKDKRTIVIVTHNNDIIKIADRVYTMKNGKIINERKNKNPLSVRELDW
ncbi:MAG: ABC transporter ATP-binding protein [Clostridia bacterium]|nr:ABC transporter ATP-binding protein [Clostridia bacterium]